MNDHEQYADEGHECPMPAEEKAYEIALDVADEQRFAAEEARRLQVTPDDHECQAEYIDGTLDYCGCDDCNDREAAESDEWRPGGCDHCYGQTVSGPLGDIYCACAIGQGAAPEDCVCRPEAGGDA